MQGVNVSMECSQGLNDGSQKTKPDLKKQVDFADVISMLITKKKTTNKKGNEKDVADLKILNKLKKDENNDDSIEVNKILNLKDSSYIPPKKTVDILTLSSIKKKIVNEEKEAKVDMKAVDSSKKVNPKVKLSIINNKEKVDMKAADSSKKVNPEVKLNSINNKEKVDMKAADSSKKVDPKVKLNSIHNKEKVDMKAADSSKKVDPKVKLNSISNKEKVDIKTNKSSKKVKMFSYKKPKTIELKENKLLHFKSKYSHETLDNKVAKVDLNNQIVKNDDFKKDIFDKDISTKKITKKEENSSGFVNFKNDISKMELFSKNNVNGAEHSTSSKFQSSDVSEQIVQKMKVMLGSKQSTMEVQLKPEYLGKVKILLHTVDGEITARIITDNNNTANILNSSLNNLKQNLEQQGLKVQQFGVDVGGQQHDNQTAQDDSENNRRNYYSSQMSVEIESDAVEKEYGDELYNLNILA